MFCQTCQTEKPKERMKLIEVGKSKKLWRCVDCIQRRSDMQYKSKGRS